MLTRDPLSWMWVEACDMLDRMDRLHRRMFSLQRPASRRPNWEPPMDIFEAGEALRIVVLLPGVPADRITVSLDNDGLIITGERPLQFNGPAIIHRLEIPYGCFEKRIPLSPDRYELVGSELVHGCLTLSLVDRNRTTGRVA